MSLGLKSPATQVFVQQFVRTNNIKETSKACITDLLWREPPVTGGVPHPHKGPVMWKGFSLYHDVMMENIYIFIMISFGACSCLRLNYLSIP